MAIPFNFVVLFKSVFLGDLFLPSRVIFACAISVECVYLLMAVFLPKIKEKKPSWLIYFNTLCFFCDLFASFLIAITVNIKDEDFAVIYCLAFIRYMLLIALYAVILLYKRLNAIKKATNTPANTTVNSEYVNAYTLAENKKPCVYIKEEVFPINEPLKLADVNVAYILALCDCLKNKNLTDEQRQTVEELEFDLKFPISSSYESLKTINEKFKKIIKMMAEYNVTV